MTGVFIGIWFTPVMTTGHLLFAPGMSLYVVIGVAHEERDLIAAFGERYHDYIGRTSRIFPGRRASGNTGDQSLQGKDLNRPSKQAANA